jgi:hypothetical protein
LPPFNGALVFDDDDPSVPVDDKVAFFAIKIEREKNKFSYSIKVVYIVYNKIFY